MRNARKTPKILELEKPDEVQKDPFKELFKPDAIVERSKRSLGISGAMTLAECMPPLQLIAKRYNLKLHLKREYDRAVEILKKERS